jgi:hypothetical protein
MPDVRPHLGAFIAVLATHAVLLVVLVAMRVTVTPIMEVEMSAEFFPVPPSEDRSASTPARAPRAAGVRHTQAHDAGADREALPARRKEEGSAPVGIDWAQEAERAAARQIDADEAAARRAAAFSPRKGTLHALEPAAPLKPPFGWSYARTHRVEALPGGGIIFNLNDRCAIVFAVMLIPVCKVGALEPRGDLLQHMRDAPLLGAAAPDLP